MIVQEGNRTEGIQPALLEHFNPGQKVSLYMKLARPLSDLEWRDWELQARSGGAKLTYGTIAQWGWDNAVRLDFTRPSRTDGYGFSWTLAFIFGIPAIIVAWKLSEGVQSNMMGLAVIAGLVIIAVVALRRPKTAKVGAR